MKLDDIDILPKGYTIGTGKDLSGVFYYSMKNGIIVGLSKDKIFKYAMRRNAIKYCWKVWK